MSWNRIKCIDERVIRKQVFQLFALLCVFLYVGVILREPSIQANYILAGYLHGKCACVIIDDDAEHPHITDGIFHVPKDLDARAKPFSIDHVQISSLNDDILEAYDWCVQNEKNCATLRKLVSNEEFIEGLPDAEQNLLRALRMIM
jgi:hypothetical protein